MALTSLQTIAPEMELENHPWRHEEFCKAQMQDDEIQRVMEWLEKSDTKPPWDVVALCSIITKKYWAQWDSLCLKDGVLYRLWDTQRPGDLAVSTAKSTTPKCLAPSSQYTNCGSPGCCKNIKLSSRTFLLGWMSSGCPVVTCVDSGMAPHEGHELQWAHK